MTHFLTAEGKKQLEEKLNYYKSTRRVEASEKIAIAREFGDLSENSEYDAAKEEQGQIEAEIREMEDILLNCQIIDNNVNEGVVNIGSTVRVYDEEFDEEFDSLPNFRSGGVQIIEIDEDSFEEKEERPVARFLLSPTGKLEKILKK